MPRAAALGLLLALGAAAAAGAGSRLIIEDDVFLLDGKPHQIIAGRWAPLSQGALGI